MQPALRLEQNHVADQVIQTDLQTRVPFICRQAAKMMPLVLYMGAGFLRIVGRLSGFV